MAQIRFAPTYAVEERELVANFQRKLGRRYLASESRTQQQVIALQIGPEGPQPPKLGPGETVWPFKDTERPWTVLLSSTSLSLESQDYRDFDDFASEFETVLTALSEVFEPQQETRLGLRYINQIEDTRLLSRGLRHFLTEELVTPVGSALGTDLISSLSELRFRERDGVMVLRHGLTDPAAYLLDFDRFSEGSQDFTTDGIVKRVIDYHGLIERLFVWSVSNRYLKELKGGKR